MYIRLAVLLTALIAAGAGAETPVSASRFYIVGADGRSAPDPTVRYQRPERKVVVGTAAPSRQKATAKPPQRQPDPFEDFRCEQAGFYYTSDGRCVAPAMSARRLRPSRPRN